MAQSKFKISVPILYTPVCNIQQGSEVSKLLHQVELIIWDEALMAHKLCFIFYIYKPSKIHNRV